MHFTDEQKRMGSRKARRRGRLLACAFLLRTGGADASSHCWRAAADSSEFKPLLHGRVGRLLLRLPPPRTARAGSVNEGALDFRCRRRGEGAVGCEGTRGRTRKSSAFVVPPPSFLDRADRLDQGVGDGVFAATTKTAAALVGGSGETRVWQRSSSHNAASSRRRKPALRQRRPRRDDEQFDRPEVPKWTHKAVIVPG